VRGHDVQLFTKLWIEKGQLFAQRFTYDVRLQELTLLDESPIRLDISDKYTVTELGIKDVYSFIPPEASSAMNFGVYYEEGNYLLKVMAEVRKPTDATVYWFDDEKAFESAARANPILAIPSNVIPPTRGDSDSNLKKGLLALILGVGVTLIYLHAPMPGQV